jgi:hypothetical protein
MILEPPLYPNHSPLLSEMTREDEDQCAALKNGYIVPKLRGRVAELMEFARNNAPYVNGFRRTIRLEIAADPSRTLCGHDHVDAYVYLENPGCTFEHEGEYYHQLTEPCECKPLATKRLK